MAIPMNVVKAAARHKMAASVNVCVAGWYQYLNFCFRRFRETIWHPNENRNFGHGMEDVPSLVDTKAADLSRREPSSSRVPCSMDIAVTKDQMSETCDALLRGRKDDTLNV